MKSIKSTRHLTRTAPALGAAICLAAGSLANGVLAQDQAGGRRMLEEVVVTAQKRQESLQDVPLAVSAVTGDKIADLHITDLQGLRGSVPNVQINNFSNTPNGAVFFIRGVGVSEPDPYAGNTVSVVVDGVPQTFNMIALLDLFDIERVEVLRGPQGTLFGANTTGGVINVVTNQPTGEFGGKAELSVGNWDRRDAKLAVDFPIIENVLAGKVTLMHHQRDGWVDNVVNGDDMGSQNITAGRGYLKWTPADDFDATLMTEYVRSRNGSPIVVSGAVPGEALFVPPGTQGMYQQPCVSVNQPCDAPDDYDSANSSVPDQSDRDTYSATLTMNWYDTGIGDVVSITGYKEFELEEYTDQDGTPLFLDDTFRETEGWQFSQELRTTINLTDRLEILLGGFYLQTHYEHLQDFRIQFAAPGFRQENPQEQDRWAGSVFGQAYYDLTDKLQLLFGLRFTHEEKEMEAGIRNFIDLDGMVDFGGGIPIGGFLVEDEDEWDNWGGKIGLNYQLNPDVLLYGYYARGFKSGGFTGRVGIPADIGPFDPEKVDTYEAGIKGDFFDGMMRANLAAFYTEYEDMQLAQIYFTEDAMGTIVQGNTILNAATSTIQGLELEMTFLPPVPGLTIGATLGYLDAEFDEFEAFDPNIGSFVDYSGNDLQNTPEFTGSLSATYEFPLADGEARARVEYQYSDEKYLTSFDNSPRTLIQSTDLVNATLDWSPDNGNWTIGLWARNLTDERYLASVFEARGTLAIANYAPPREWGASVKFEF
jgi:iron complex outermembrane receptor protein